MILNFLVVAFLYSLLLRCVGGGVCVCMFVCIYIHHCFQAGLLQDQSRQGKAIQMRV